MLNEYGLKLLKEGEEGYGLLVEHDAGSISLDMNQQLLKEGKFHFDPKNPYINCILQKYGVENKNKRVYPENILKSQVEIYGELVSNNSAIGELNHPDCVDSESMILTCRGWKFIKDIEDDEEIYSLNITNKNIETHKIKRKIVEPYNGTMYHFTSRNLDILCTPNHKFLLEDRYGNKTEFHTANEIFENRKKYNKYKIIKTGNWEGDEKEYFIIEGYKKSDNLKRLQKKDLEDLIIDNETWVAFLGIYLAEGHCKGVKSLNKRGFNLKITQKKPENIIKIEELLKKIPVKVSKNIKKDGTVNFSINDRRLFNYLFPLGDSYHKYIPENIKNYSPRLLAILLEWFQLGDGRKVKNKKNEVVIENIFSTSKKMIQDFNEVLLKIGTSGNITINIHKDRYIGDRLIKAENSVPLYVLNFSRTEHIYLDDRHVNIEKIDFNDKVYCVEVENNNFFIMRNGKSHWTGNSSNIDLWNIPHRVVKMWWIDNTLHGTLEIITSPAYNERGEVHMPGDFVMEYLKRGIRLGISSRGLGTLKKSNGKNIVQADYELVCFDLVFNPSTSGAYLYTKNQEKTQFSESQLINKPLIITSEIQTVNKKNTILLEQFIKKMS
jgi:hypothetical protein